MNIFYSLFLTLIVSLFIHGCSDHRSVYMTHKDLELMADSLYEFNQYSDAIGGYLTLLSIDSLNGKYHYKLAYSLVQLDRNREALPHYIKSAELGYRIHDCYFNLGTTYKFAFGDYEMAKKYLELALELQPNSKKTIELLDSTMNVEILQ